MEISLGWRRVDLKDLPDISVELRPLKVWAFQKLIASQAGNSDGKSQEALDGLTMLEVAKEIFPEHVRAVKGIVVSRDDGESSDVTLEDLTTETQLITVSAAILSQLFEISQLTEMEQKNFGNPLGNG